MCDSCYRVFVLATNDSHSTLSGSCHVTLLGSVCASAMFPSQVLLTTCMSVCLYEIESNITYGAL